MEEVNYEKRKQQFNARIRLILLKIFLVITFVFLAFTFVFGISRANTMDMSPAINQGDIIIYFRLDRSYGNQDVVMVKEDHKIMPLRITGVPGDKINIDEQGLVVNGYEQNESFRWGETLPYAEKTAFPLTLGEHQYFMLGDNRTGAEDSRAFGPVSEKDIRGRVITVIKHRGI